MLEISHMLSLYFIGSIAVPERKRKKKEKKFQLIPYNYECLYIKIPI